MLGTCYMNHNDVRLPGEEMGTETGACDSRRRDKELQISSLWSRECNRQGSLGLRLAGLDCGKKRRRKARSARDKIACAASPNGASRTRDMAAGITTHSCSPIANAFTLQVLAFLCITQMVGEL